MKPKADIALTADELGLFEKIVFNWERPDPEAFAENGENVAALMTSLAGSRRHSGAADAVLHKSVVPNRKVEGLAPRFIPSQSQH